MRFVSWNVNGIRAASRYGFADWLKKDKADVVCLQETKAHVSQLELLVAQPKGYHAYWHSAKKPGYSGVAILSKREPLKITEGLGFDDIDDEGRVLVAEYSDVTLVNAYFPNSQRELARLPYKLAFCQRMHKFLNKQRKLGKSIVICGDFNIAHKEIDLKNPKSNKKNAGFLPEERAWLDEFVDDGYIDTFRQFEQGPDHYSWWSNRPGVREKNVGWRLDYHFASASLKDRLKKAAIHPEVRGSDHCPVSLDLRD